MFNNEFNYEYRSSPQGTLQSQGLYYQPPIPNQGTPRGTRPADGRAYTRTLQRGETTQGRLEDLLSNESGYIQNARRRAAEGANARGLLNSSIAQGASQRAAIEAGMPIAQADAQAAFGAGTQNLQAMNENLMQERDIANRALMQRESLANSLQNARLQADTQRYGIDIGLLGDREQRAYGGEQAGLDRAHQYGMSMMDQMQQLERMGYGAQVDDWLQSQGLTRDMVRMGYGNTLEQSNMSLADQIQRGQMGLGFQFDSRLSDQSYRQQLGLNEQGFGFDTRLTDQNYRNQLGLNQQNYGFDIGRMGYGNQLEQSNMSLADIIQRGQMGLGYEQDLGRMREGSALSIQEMMQRYGLDEQAATNQFRRNMQEMVVSGRYGLSLQALGDMWQNPDIYSPTVTQGFFGFLDQVWGAENWAWMDDIFGGGG